MNNQSKILRDYLFKNNIPFIIKDNFEESIIRKTFWQGYQYYECPTYEESSLSIPDIENIGAKEVIEIVSKKNFV